MKPGSYGRVKGFPLRKPGIGGRGSFLARLNPPGWAKVTFTREKVSGKLTVQNEKEVLNLIANKIIRIDPQVKELILRRAGRANTINAALRELLGMPPTGILPRGLSRGEGRPKARRAV